MDKTDEKVSTEGENPSLICGVSSCLLPTKSIIDKIIIEEYINMYGTNYDDYSLENAKKGALIIVNWILNNR